MKTPLSLMSAALIVATCSAAARERERINFDWRFAYDEQAGAEQAAYDDSAYEGRVLLVVRAQRQPGRIDIRATSPGLEAATLSIQTVQWKSPEGE